MEYATRKFNQSTAKNTVCVVLGFILFGRWKECNHRIRIATVRNVSYDQRKIVLSSYKWHNYAINTSALICLFRSQIMSIYWHYLWNYELSKSFRCVLSDSFSGKRTSNTLIVFQLNVWAIITFIGFGPHHRDFFHYFNNKCMQISVT